MRSPRTKAETRRRIQEQALRLSEQRGFDSTTVEEVAASAGVSHMTVFRHFPTKEDLVARHDYGDELKDQIRARPTDEDALLRVERGAREGLSRVGPSERTGMRRRIRLLLSAPSLRARRLVTRRNGKRPSPRRSGPGRSSATIRTERGWSPPPLSAR